MTNLSDYLEKIGVIKGYLDDVNISPKVIDRMFNALEVSLLDDTTISEFLLKKNWPKSITLKRIAATFSDDNDAVLFLTAISKMSDDSQQAEDYDPSKPPLIQFKSLIKSITGREMSNRGIIELASLTTYGVGKLELLLSLFPNTKKASGKDDDPGDILVYDKLMEVKIGGRVDIRPGHIFNVVSDVLEDLTKHKIKISSGQELIKCWDEYSVKYSSKALAKSLIAAVENTGSKNAPFRHPGILEDVTKAFNNGIDITKILGCLCTVHYAEEAGFDQLLVFDSVGVRHLTSSQNKFVFVKEINFNSLLKTPNLGFYIEKSKSTGGLTSGINFKVV